MQVNMKNLQLLFVCSSNSPSHFEAEYEGGNFEKTKNWSFDNNKHLKTARS